MNLNRTPLTFAMLMAKRLISMHLTMLREDAGEHVHVLGSYQDSTVIYS